MKKITWIMFCALLFSVLVWAQEPQTPAQAPQNNANAAAQPAAAAQPKAPAADASEASLVIPKDAKVFVASMPDGFDDIMKKAIASKKVPITLVDKREDAEFELTGYSESQKAGTAKKLIMGSWHSRESASIKVANLKSGVVAFAYSYNTDNSTHGKRSSAESCAKHLKEKVESGK
ncbi:MAG TPA: hypothetical protein VFU86_04565 [Terriglobales bacterium]|nr:hypothetical protein [Terriglobales bacterium]